MKDLVLFKNNKVKPLKKNKKYKESKVDSIFIKVHSELFGTAYKRISLKTYKYMKKISECKLKFSFLNGALTDDTEDELKYLSDTFKYTYVTPIDVLVKLDEIYMTENILNDAFWVFDSFYQYIFYDFKSKVYTIKDKKFKYNSISDLYRRFKYKKEPIYFREPVKNKALCIFDSSYAEFDINKKSLLKNINSYGSKLKYFANIYQDLYVNINPKFFTKVKKFDIETKILITDYNGEKDDYNSYDLIYTNKDKLKMSTIFERLMWKDVIERLEEGEVYTCKSKVRVNGKDKIPLKDFYKKYFNN